jgi:activator of HSP90 ATPase
VRKGKQILVYDFDLELEVVGEHQEEDNSDGSYKVREILSDDLNDMIVDEVRATEKNKTADLLKKWIKKNAKAKIIEVFRHLEEELMKQEGDPAKLQEDKRKREENLLATQKAREEKGAEKERLLEEQKLKEQKLKEVALVRSFEESVKVEK